MVARHDGAAGRAERARAIGLFRYQLVREAADPGLSSKARGRLVRSIAAAEHTDPFGRRLRVSRDTLTSVDRLSCARALAAPRQRAEQAPASGTTSSL